MSRPSVKLDVLVRRQTVSKCTVNAFRWVDYVLLNVPVLAVAIIKITKVFFKKPNSVQQPTDITLEAVIVRRLTAERSTVNVSTQEFPAPKHVTVVIVITKKVIVQKEKVVLRRTHPCIDLNRIY